MNANIGVKINQLCGKIARLEKTTNGSVGSTGPMGFTGSTGPMGATGTCVCGITGFTTDENTAIGIETLASLTLGFNNTGVGRAAFSSLTTGSGNVGIGTNALINNMSGFNNVGLGLNAGNFITTGNGNVCIGSNATVDSFTAIRRIAIGDSVTNTVDNSIFFRSDLGTIAAATDVTFASAGGGRLAPVSSTRRMKDNITDIEIDTSKIYNLNPVSFHHKSNPEDVRTFGLIAEDVYEHIPELVPLDDEGLPASVRYSTLSVLLLNEIKKLKENEIKMLQRIENLEKAM